MIMATTIFLAILMVVANLLTDIAYKIRRSKNHI